MVAVSGVIAAQTLRIDMSVAALIRFVRGLATDRDGHVLATADRRDFQLGAQSGRCAADRVFGAGQRGALRRPSFGGG